jgi:hypothetical protein
MHIYFFCYFLLLQVFTPNKVYNGQKLMNDVAKKTPPNTNNTVPKVPVIVPVVKRMVIIIANEILKALSTDPIFFFIKVSFV